MQIIIIGCGKVGAKFAQTLSKDGHGVVVVSNDGKAFRNLAPDFDGVTLTGVPIDQDVLKNAGIENADALVAVTEDDNTNIMTCQVAKEIFKVPKVIARIYNPSREHVFHQFGLDTICPTDITVNAMRSLVDEESCLSTHTIGSTSVVYKHQKVSEHYIGRKAENINLKEGMVFGVLRQGSFLFINKAGRLAADDVLVIADTAH